MRSFQLSIRAKEKLISEKNLNVKDGRGRYPKCLPEKPYRFCPNETPEDPKKFLVIANTVPNSLTVSSIPKFT